MKKLAFLLVLVFGLAHAQTRGGELRVAILAEPPVLDPSASTSQEIARMMYDNVLQGLVKLNEKGEIVPALAEKWQGSSSSLTWVFNLRKGVRFHNGAAFTAEDVVFKFNRARDPRSGHTNPAYYRDIASIEARDSHTVVIRLRQPNQDFLFNLARPDSVIGPKGRVEEQRTQPVGTGPFRFVSWERGVGVRLERFDGYYEPGLPYLDRVFFRFLPDPNAQIAALKAGDIDVIGLGLSPENALLVQRDSNLRLVVGTTTTEITVGMNNARPPFNDPRVRRAIQHAVDKRELIQGVMLGFGTPIGSHRSPAESCYADLSGFYSYDPAKARAFLQEAGYGAGNPLRFTFTLAAPYPYERRLGEAIAAKLQAVGVQAQLEVVEWATWLSRVFRGADYQMTIIGHSEPNDIGIYSNPSYYFRYNSQKFRDLYARYIRNPDPKQACESMKELQRLLAEDAVNLWVMNSPYLAAMRREVAGWWQNQPTPSLNLTRVYWNR